MEHLFRIALCMSLLVVYLQAKPLSPECPKSNIRKRLLEPLSEVTCGDNVTFTSPTVSQGSCFPAASKVFMDGLTKAATNCTGVTERADQVYDAFKKAYPDNTESQPTAECNGKTEKQFPEFLEDMKKFVQQINSHC